MSLVIVVILFLTSIFLLWGCKKYLKNGYKILNPLNVLIVVWNAAIIFHWYLFGLSNNAFMYAVILLSLIGSSVGFLIGSNKVIVFSRKTHNSCVKYSEKLFQKKMFFFLICEFLAVLLSFFTIYKLTGGRIDYLFTNATFVRNLYLARGEESVGKMILNMFVSINSLLGNVGLGICCAKKYKGWLFYLFSFVVLNFMSAFITMSKMSFFIFLIIFITSLLNSIENIKSQKIMLRKVGPLAGTLLISFLVIIGIQRNYQTGEVSMLKYVLEKAGFYFASPLEAFSMVLDDIKSEYGIVKNTFVLVYKFFVRLGFVQGSAISNHLDGVLTSLGMTNVYSWYYFFYQDISYLGMILYPTIFSFFAGLAYSPSETRFGQTAANSIFAALFLMSFYGFLWTQGTYFYALIYAFIFDALFMKNVYVEESDFT